MPMPNINNIMPFHSGGGRGAAYYSPIVFIIFASINVRQLESTFFSNHAECNNNFKGKVGQSYV